MKLVVVGVNHEEMDMDERKLFYFHESDKLAFSTKLLDLMIDQVCILSTCNRSEVYVMCDDSFDESKLKEAFLSYFHQDNPHIMLLSKEEALLHLLEVSCGLQSMVVGEDQILHQIKEALSWTMQQKFGGKELYYILQNVISFAKTMRSTYAMSEHPLSVSYIGYQCLQEYLKVDDKIMICGIGEMARLMLEYLKGYSIYLVNRTYENVEPYLNDHTIYVPFDNRYDYIEDVDIVISATASPHVLFKKEKLSSRPQVFLDLAMPRDIDHSIKTMKNKVLIDMDDLKSISLQQLEKRKEICEIIKKECILKKDELLQGLAHMKSDNIIQRMQARYLDISNETYQLLKNKLDLSPREDYILKKVLKSSFLRLMKDPIRVLKSDDFNQQQYIEFVEKMLETKE